MIVTNLRGTGELRCFCPSWLEHWFLYSRATSVAAVCRSRGCDQSKGLVGAHVKKYKSVDQKTYIVPLCQKHNMSNDSIDIGNAPLARANVSVTCGL